MKTLKRISPKSLARLMGVMYAVLGLIFGLFMMLVALLFPVGQEPGIAGILFGIAAPIFLTVLYGLMGWIGGYLSAWIYNAVAKRTGGVMFEIE